MAGMIFVFSHGTWAEETVFSMRVIPGRYIGVDGDDEKFRAHHWMKDGFTGGVDLSSRASHNGAELELGGRALPDPNDLGGLLSFRKEGLGFARAEFSEFRKYYDGTGGVYHFFNTLQANETDKELALDIGSFSVETGLTVEGWPELSFLYDRHSKDGAKSRLTWTSVKEGATTRNIGPSWQDVDEVTDSFALKAGHTLAGFELTGEQSWEFVRADFTREEKSLSTTATASDRKIRRQDQQPESDLLTTSLNAQRNFLGEKLFFSAGYRFSHMDNREFETIIETNEAGTATNFSNPKQIRDARADNDYDAHTWVNSLALAPWKWFSVISRLKAEVVRRESSSSYPADAAPNSAGGSAPNGVIDQRVVSLNETKAVRFGEALSLRFTGLPRTALYAETELEQAQARVAEDRKDLLGPNAGETFNRFTITDMDRFHAALGGQTSPCRYVSATSQISYRRNNNDYDDQRETDPTGSTARSAFFDGQRVETKEWSSRLSFKPHPRLHPSLRYQLRDDDFATRVEAEPIVKTGTLSHIVTADLSWQASEKLLGTASFSRQTASVTTPARAAAAAGNTPTFNVDVNTWLLSADCAATSKLTFTGTAQYTWADNFNDFSDTGLPLGVESEQVDLTGRLTVAFGKDASVSAEYGFFHYRANSSAEAGDYDAHRILVEGTKKF